MCDIPTSIGAESSNDCVVVLKKLKYSSASENTTESSVNTPNLFLKKKISAMVLVGKNEPYLTYCVNSIEGIVDQIVFIPYKEGEETDFSKWRNQALKEAKGNWILYIDADEILAKPDGKPVTRAELELLAKNDKGIKAFSPFTLHFLYNYKMIDGTNNGQHYSQFRFFEKASVKEYRGKIHELPNFKVGTKVAPLHTMYVHHYNNISEFFTVKAWKISAKNIPEV